MQYSGKRGAKSIAGRLVERLFHQRKPRRAVAAQPSYRMEHKGAASAEGMGRRAADLREELGWTLGDVAQRTGQPLEDIRRFERSGEGSIELLIAVNSVLSYAEDLSRILTTPKFESLDQVEAFERRRTGR